MALPKQSVVYMLEVPDSAVYGSYGFTGSRLGHLLIYHSHLLDQIVYCLVWRKYELMLVCTCKGPRCTIYLICVCVCDSQFSKCFEEA